MLPTAEDVFDLVDYLGGGAEGDRTPDLVNAIHALSQLSYGPYSQAGDAEGGADPLTYDGARECASGRSPAQGIRTAMFAKRPSGGTRTKAGLVATAVRRAQQPGRR